MSKTSKKHGVKILNWGITAGPKQCLYAGPCAAYCYAKQGTYTWSNVSPAFEARYQLSLTGEFVHVISDELRRRKPTHVRIHDSGDFYSMDYLHKWAWIMDQHPQIEFYAYTKALPLIRALRKTRPGVPDNFTVIYSYGGVLDNQINDDIQRHAKVFSSVEELYAAGYVDASHDDLIAVQSPNHKIGLVYHGSKAKGEQVA
jgi:hypothetical protein